MQSVCAQRLQDPQQILAAMFSSSMATGRHTQSRCNLHHDASWIAFCSRTVAPHKSNCYLATVCKSQLMCSSFWDCMWGDILLSFSVRCGRKVLLSALTVVVLVLTIKHNISTISFTLAMILFFHRTVMSMNLFSGHKPKTSVCRPSFITSAVVIFFVKHGLYLLSSLWLNQGRFLG